MIKALFKLLFLMLLSFKATTLKAQKYCLQNETVIFSCSTSDRKIITLNKDKDNQYVVYRFGTKQKIELEKKEIRQGRYASFKCTKYLRGGGLQNEGMDLNGVYFQNQGYEYALYDNYFAVGNKIQIGVKVTNLSTNKVTDIKGVLQTKKGTLANLADDSFFTLDDSRID